MIAIKGMEMPSCCAECNLTGSFNWEHYCDVTLGSINLDSDTRPDNCPLVKIEEHKLERIEQIVERFKSRYDHTSSLDLMAEINDVLNG